MENIGQKEERKKGKTLLSAETSVNGENLDTFHG
jgi:hypothetical protein